MQLGPNRDCSGGVAQAQSRRGKEAGDCHWRVWRRSRGPASRMAGPDRTTAAGRPDGLPVSR